MAVLTGVEVAEVREIVDEAMEPVLKPLVYREALDLAASHAAAGESSYLVSAALEEIVQAVAAEVGFAGAIGSRCGIVDGIYTGRVERALYGARKAKAVQELAAASEIDLAASTAYSDSYTDLAFLESVGRPVAVNPDRNLRRTALRRGWPVLRFGTRAFESV
jgi:HAD superfamily hydrolase (TIGR01490 family)